MKTFISGIMVMLGLAAYGLAGITLVEPGEVGIKIKNLGENRGMQPDTLGTGIHWVEPIQYDTVTYDTRLKQQVIDNLPGQSKDGQDLHIDVSLEIGLADGNVPFLHESIGRNWYEQVIYPAVRSSIRNESSRHLSDEIYTGKGRTLLQQGIQDTMDEKGKQFGILININLRGLSFTNQDFIATLENKAIAAQNVIIEERNAEKAEYTALQSANIAEGEKQKKIKQAEAERERLKLVGEGQRLRDEEKAKGILALKKAEAEGNRLQVQAFGDGSTYASVKWAEHMGPNVKVLGYPLGAPGTTGLFNVNGVLGNALKIKGAGAVGQ